MCKMFGTAGKINYFQATLIFFLVLAAYPYVFDRFWPVPSMQIVSMVVFVLLTVSLLGRYNLRPLPKRVQICAALQIIGWAAYYIIHGDSSYFTRIFFILLTYVVCLVIYNNEGFLLFMRRYNYWMALQAILALVAFILVFVGILSPLLTSENTDGRPVYFFGITCSNAYYLGNLIRSAGFFDEPGALAFWGIYALLFNKLFVGSKNTEIALIIGLLSTLSLAYFIQLPLYFIFFSIKHFRSSVLHLVSVAVITLFAYNQGINSKLYDLTFGRVEKNIEYGTNRDKMTEEAQRVYDANPVFGVGGSNMEKYEYMSDNPYEILAKDGMVGMVITYFPLLLLAFARWQQRDILLAILLLMVGYMQRPFHIGFLHYFMIYTFMVMGLLYYKKNGTTKSINTGNSDNGSL